MSRIDCCRGEKHGEERVFQDRYREKRKKKKEKKNPFDVN